MDYLSNKSKAINKFNERVLKNVLQFRMRYNPIVVRFTAYKNNVKTVYIHENLPHEARFNKHSFSNIKINRAKSFFDLN